MDIKVNIATSGDVIFEAVFVFAPASNYSDGIDKGFRPAIRWAAVRLPNTIIRSGMMNLKGCAAEATPKEAVAAARVVLFDGDCICSAMVDAFLEKYEREV